MAVVTRSQSRPYTRSLTNPSKADKKPNLINEILSPYHHKKAKHATKITPTSAVATIRSSIPSKVDQYRILKRLNMEIHNYMMTALHKGVSDYGFVSDFIREYQEVYPWLTRVMVVSYRKKNPIQISEHIPHPLPIEIECCESSSVYSDISAELSVLHTKQLLQIPPLTIGPFCKEIYFPQDSFKPSLTNEESLHGQGIGYELKSYHRELFVETDD